MEPNERIMILLRSGFGARTIAAMLGVDRADVTAVARGASDVLPGATGGVDLGPVEDRLDALEGIGAWTPVPLVNGWVSYTTDGVPVFSYRIEGHELRFRGIPDGRGKTADRATDPIEELVDFEGRRAGLATWNYGFGYASGEFNIRTDGIYIYTPGANLAFCEFALGI